MIAPVSAVIASAVTVLLLFLSYRVSGFRLKYKQGLGVNDDRDFEVAVRSQANLVEYAPVALIVLALAEINGVSATLIYWAGMGFFIARVLHAWGMYKGRGGTHPARLVGALLTWLSMLAMAVLAVFNVVQLSV
ncbi:MAPEG family protein [Marinobacter sp. X15-166B]|uniref:MAPEG family protein n=1 Tax=Marinobacter sp. X15-166B TaxID=1897620 RepID=UPI00085BED61|nr:MAPEG family protein [Marinobacter sp. X15-166B]OEY65809.1 glutathione metabolism protein [Marinobacter sp. X15-166B]